MIKDQLYSFFKLLAELGLPQWGGTIASVVASVIALKLARTNRRLEAEHRQEVKRDKLKLAVLSLTKATRRLRDHGELLAGAKDGYSVIVARRTLGHVEQFTDYALQQHVAMPEVLEATAELTANVNYVRNYCDLAEDGRISGEDAAKISQAIIGKESSTARLDKLLVKLRAHLAESEVHRPRSTWSRFRRAGKAAWESFAKDD